MDPDPTSKEPSQTSQPSSLVVAVLLVLLSALTNALAFPPWSLRPLAFVSLVPLLLALRSGGILRALGLAVLWSEAWCWTIASVFPGSMASFYGRSDLFGILMGSLIFFVMAGVYYASFAAADRVFIRRASPFTPLLVAAVWVVAELGRGRLFTGSAFFIGNPWGLQGYTHASGALAQIASFTGVYGIGFVLVAVNAGLAALIGAWPNRSLRGTGLRAFALSLLPVMAVGLYGSAVLSTAPEPTKVTGLQKVAVIQGNVSIDRRWRSDYHGKNLDVYLRGTDRVLRSGEPRLVVWPETSLNFFLDAEPRYRDAIIDTLARGSASLLVGGPSSQGDKQPPYYNSVFLVDAERGVRQRYDKEYLVPFSEYIPALSSDWMQRQIDGARTFEAGAPNPLPLETEIGRVGVLICNEAMLPEIAAARVRNGAEILVSPSNDSWIRGRAFGEHMLAVVGLRSIEQRRYLIRASTAGPSAVVDPWGRVTARTESSTEATLRGGVMPQTSLTVYGRFGDAFAMCCLLVVGGVLVRSHLRPLSESFEKSR
jgi:apolipoprotein N-acyltransferase